MPRVLVVEDSPTQAQHISIMLEEAGHEVEMAGNGRAALAVLHERPADLVVTDLDMPEMNGLQLVEAVRRDYPSVPVILMTAHGSEEIAALALRTGAASYVPKAYMAQDLVPTVASILSMAEPAAPAAPVLEALTQSAAQFNLPNDPALIPGLINHLDGILTRLKFGDPHDRLRISVALREALLNAMDHGNLQVSTDLRQDDESIYHETARQRRQEAPYCDRRVHLRTQLSGSEVVFVVRDEGPGFDPASLPDPTDPANLERVGGRGLLLIRTFMDEVRHNASGNEITMIKRTGAQPRTR